MKQLIYALLVMKHKRVIVKLKGFRINFISRKESLHMHGFRCHYHIVWNIGKHQDALVFAYPAGCLDSL